MKKTGSSRTQRPDMSVRIGSLALRNPVIVASGVAGYGDELSGVANLRELGAVVTKTITLRAREGNPPPRLAELPGGLLNSIGLANMGCRAFISERLGGLKNLGTRIIVSVGGFTVREYRDVVAAVDGAGGFDAFEINISCPNVRAGGIHFGSSPSRAAAVVRAVRAVTSMPMLVKLSPGVTDISAVARACVSEGADALTVSNTFKGLSVDVRSRTPVLGGMTGGLSGPAIRALNLVKVQEVVSAVRKPVIACGGICSVNDALEYIIVGASAFQVGSACLRNSRAPELILKELKEFCGERSIRSLADVRGSLKVVNS